MTPRHGVYAAFVLVDGARYAGAANVGLRPTVEGESLNVETHILDYQGDLYGRVITVELLRHLRDERRFADVGALQRQMFGDIGRVRRICMELRSTVDVFAALLPVRGQRAGRPGPLDKGKNPVI